MMSAEEICREYRLSKHKAKAITILADMNVTTREDIIRILKENGETVAPGCYQTPGKKPAKKAKAETLPAKAAEEGAERRPAVTVGQLMEALSRMPEEEAIVLLPGDEPLRGYTFTQGEDMATGNLTVELRLY